MAAKRNELKRAVAFGAVAVLMGAGLSGCGGLGRALGVSKSSPDEFAVVTKAPLVLPPDYELRPPKPGAKRPQEVAPSEAAKQALLQGQFTTPSAPSVPANPATPAVATNTGASEGEKALLTSAGAGESGTKAAKGTGSVVKTSKDLADRLVFGGEGDAAADTDEDDKPTITKDED